jgi:DNA-directed RNA polymerase subunit beta'
MKHPWCYCEKCGTKVTLTKVRRERMAHIDLASRLHISGSLNPLPSRIGLMLDTYDTSRDIERILWLNRMWFSMKAWLVLERGSLLTDEQYLDAVEESGDEFVAKMGARSNFLNCCVASTT